MMNFSSTLIEIDENWDYLIRHEYSVTLPKNENRILCSYVQVTCIIIISVDFPFFGRNNSGSR